MRTLVAALGQRARGLLREAAFEDETARVGGARVERRRRVVVVEFRAVDRLLQVHAVMHVMQEKLRRPLVLPVAARACRTP